MQLSSSAGVSNSAPVVQQLLVVGFHHTLGNHVEFSYPPLERVPREWDAVPFLAVADGAHKFAEDYVYFSIASTSPDEPILFGVSCYQQVAASDELRKEDANVTRSSVQKAVVALSRFPLFGALQHRLKAATHVFFSSLFKDKDVLRDIFNSMNTSLVASSIRKEFLSYCHMGLDLRETVRWLGRNTLVVLKLIMAGKRVVFHSVPVGEGCKHLLGLIALIPGALTHFSIPLLRAADIPLPVPDSSLLVTGLFSSGTENERVWEQLGFPLLPFSNTDLVMQQWSSQLTGKRAHHKMLFVPYASLHLLDEMKAADGFVACCSNELFVSLPPDQVHAVVRRDGRLELRQPGIERVVGLTTPDKRFMDEVLNTIGSAAGDNATFVGSDQWVRDEFRDYWAGLLSCASKVEEIFEANPAHALKLTPQLAEYGQQFVLDWVQTGCFARWCHSFDRKSNLEIILHPSGPPSDTLDSLSDAAADAVADLAVFRDKARKKFSEFYKSFSSSDQAAAASSPPAVTAPAATDPNSSNSAALKRRSTEQHRAAPPPPTAEPTPPPQPSEGDLISKFKKWWVSDPSAATSPPAAGGSAATTSGAPLPPAPATAPLQPATAPAQPSYAPPDVPQRRLAPPSSDPSNPAANQKRLSRSSDHRPAPAPPTTPPAARPAAGSDLIQFK